MILTESKSFQFYFKRSTVTPAAQIPPIGGLNLVGIVDGSYPIAPAYVVVNLMTYYPLGIT